MSLQTLDYKQGVIRSSVMDNAGLSAAPWTPAEEGLDPNVSAKNEGPVAKTNTALQRYG